MKILINALIVTGLLVGVTTPAEAHPREWHHTHSHSYYQNHYDNYYYRNYHHNHHRRRSDNDDWAWAVGGLVLGAIIADSANSNPPQNSQPLPPPQRRKVVTCYDEVAYDSDNKPYVARQCYETMQ